MIVLQHCVSVSSASISPEAAASQREPVNYNHLPTIQGESEKPNSEAEVNNNNKTNPPVGFLMMKQISGRTGWLFPSLSPNYSETLGETEGREHGEVEMQWPNLMQI